MYLDFIDVFRSDGLLNFKCQHLQYAGSYNLLTILMMKNFKCPLKNMLVACN